MKTLNALGDARPATKEFMRYLEQQAMILRQRAGVGPLDPFDPQRLLAQARLKIAYPKNVDDLHSDVLDYFSTLDPTTWSGMGRALPDGKLLVLLNPNMTPERESVTIMEEVAHVHYGHQHSELVTHPTGFEQRKYNKQIEQEAYWTAAAVLLPGKAVAFAVWRGETAEDLMTAYNVSIELAEMRIKTLGLWSHYNRNPLPLRRAS